MVHSSFRGASILAYGIHAAAVDFFAVAKAQFISKLKACGYCNKYVEYVCTHNNFVRPHWSSSRRPLRRFKSDCVWLVVPFHPLYEHHGLKSHIARHVDCTLYKNLLMEAFQSVDVPHVRVAWKLSTTPFGNSLVEW